LRRTLERRPDLLGTARLDADEREMLEQLVRERDKERVHEGD
jgi:hypothetical protein